MEFVGFIRLLWAHRLAIAAGAIASIALGFFVLSSPSSQSGVASVGLVLDTPSSQLIDAEPVGADTLAWRAALVADLMGSDTLRLEVARAMRLPPERIAVLAPQMAVPTIPTPLPTRALEAGATTTEPYVLSIEAPLPVPIIGVDASAPSRAEAARLATAAADVLKADAPGATPDTDIQPYVVESAGPVHSTAIVDGPRRIIGAFIVVFAFTFWCVGVAVVAAARRAQRRRTPALVG